MDDRRTFAIKGMVCNRCISVLKTSLESLALTVGDISLGSVTISGLSQLKSFQTLEDLLASLHFEIIQDKDRKIVDHIKRIIDEVFKTHLNFDTKIKFSKLLSEELHINYDSLSSIFSKSEGKTLESFIIDKRIDKIKEYLVYTDLIAYLTGYSSVFHLSRQFKALTSFNPSHYRKIKEEKKQLMNKQIKNL